MNELHSFGIKSIKCGDVPDDGTMSTVLVDLGYTYQDSASLKESDPTVTDIMAEEVDYPVESFQELGQILLAFSIMNYTAEVLAQVKGGTVIGEAPNSQWQAPAGIVDIEKSWQLITKADLLVEIPRSKVRAVINADLKKKGVALIDIKNLVLQPKSPGLAPLNICKYQLPTVSAGNAQSVAAPTATVTGTASAFRGTTSLKAWSIVSKPVGATPVITTPDALSTGITGMSVVGDYIFKLSVTDSNGYTNSATVTITKTA